MPRWILTAEADKIQDFIFRSSHLREVVGGSQLLTRFCQEATPKLLAKQRYGRMDEATCEQVKGDIIVADGGSFTLLFDKEQDAIEFGRLLAQLYRTMTGNTLTVAPPEKWNGQPQTFATANRRARGKLALAKRQGREPAGQLHGPYMAFCASCGTALATEHARLHVKVEDERPNYLCEVCRAKASEVQSAAVEGTEAPATDEDLAFLHRFREALGVYAMNKHWSRQPEDVAGGWDSRNYVAYLVADGNGMGKVFDQCQSKEQLRNLSESLTRVLIESLAEPTKLLLETETGRKNKYLPVLPLILGGDDVFILMPAPYALDFARCFCLEYERRMKQTLTGLGLVAQPTMAAGVVICKASYPYTLAHHHGENLLEGAKQLSKSVTDRYQIAHSVVDFDVILGSRIADSSKVGNTNYRASLRPYWIVPDKDDETAEEWYALNERFPLLEKVGYPLDRIIAWRRELGGTPTRRMAQLRTLFSPQSLPKEREDPLKQWQPRLEKWRARVVARHSLSPTVIDRLLHDLGGTAPGWRYDMMRPGVDQFYGHGIPDLLRVWDFSRKLTVDETEYTREEA